MKFKRGFKKKADELAKELRAELGLEKHSPINPFRLCQHLGVDCLGLSQLVSIGMAPEILEVLSDADHGGFSAVTIYKGADSLIVYNESHSLGRINNSICHELAHVICDHKSNLSTGNSNDPVLRTFSKEQEGEADWLGACILIPKDGLFWTCYRGMSLNKTAEYFGSSKSLARMRLNISGVKQVFQ